jgi:peptidyl-prolyl cis-trans isomerase D
MLQIIRELAKSWLFKSLLILLAISFGAWGIGDMFRGNPMQRTVASVGKIDIPVMLLEQRFQTEIPEARRVFGDDLTPEQARKVGVLDRALKIMIEEYTFDQDATRLGINIPPSSVMRKLAKEPRLLDKEGKFNTELWQHLLRQSGLTEAGFIDLERRNTARQIIISALASGMTPPKLVVDNLYLAQGDKRILEILTLRNDSLRNKIPEPKDADLEAYYQDNENDFIAPELRGITIAHLSGTSLVNTVKVTDEEVRKAYDTRGTEFSLPESRDLVQVVVQEETKANELHTKAAASKDLASAAKILGLSAIPMVKIDENNVLPELYTSVFALEEGQISEPVKSSLGWHVIQIKKINVGGVPSFEDAEKTIRETLMDEHAGDIISNTINQLDDSLAAGKPLEEIADSLKLHLSRYAAITQDGKGADGKKVEAVLAEEITLPAAFSASSGETSTVLENGKGDYYVVRVDSVTPSQPKPFADVKKDVLLHWSAQQMEAKAKESAEEIATALRSGTTATSFASSPGIEVRLSKPVSRLGDTDPSLPQQALSQVLSMKQGDVITASATGKQFILRLADIVPVNADKPESSRVKVLENLKESMPVDTIGQYMDYLATLFPVSIKQSVFSQIKNKDTVGNE